MSGLNLHDYAASIEPQYITWPPYVPATAMPLCQRFVQDERVFDSTVRVMQDGSMAMRVWLRSVSQNAYAAEIEQLPVSALFDKRRQALFLESVRNTFDALIAKVDYQLAAYCASNLWC